MVAEQPNRLHDDVVEVQRPRRPESLLVRGVDVRDRPLVERAGLGGELGRRDEVVLGATDHRRHRPRRVPLGVDVHLLLDDGDGSFGVSLVVDGKVAWHAEVGVLPAEDAGACGMEGEDPHALGDPGAQQPLDPLGHLLGGLVGEGDGQDLVGADAPLSDQVSDPVGQGPGLPRARPGHDQDGPFRMEDGLLLDRVQPREQGGFGRFGCHGCDSTVGSGRAALCGPYAIPIRSWPAVSRRCRRRPGSPLELRPRSGTPSARVPRTAGGPSPRSWHPRW